jgi:hypothetical protein
VTLADDVREDDAEHIIGAIRMLKGVKDVRPLLAMGYCPEIMRDRHVVAQKLIDMGRDLLK